MNISESNIRLYDPKCEILIPVEGQTDSNLAEITIPVGSLSELCSIVSDIKNIGGLYLSEFNNGLPNRIFRVEIAVYPQQNTVRGIILLDDEPLDERGNVVVSTNSETEDKARKNNGKED